MQDRPSLATIGKVIKLIPHPKADRLDVLDVSLGDREIQVVTGKHYSQGQLGVLILPPSLLPGWLAEDLWLFGRARAHQLPLFEVRKVVMREIESAGLFCGQTYAKDYSDPRSIELTQKRLKEGAKDLDNGLISWPMWRENWKVGQDVSVYLGITQI